MVPARAGSDRKTIMAIDLSSYSGATTSAPRIERGAGVSALVQDPRGVLINDEIAKDFEIGPGDPIALTVFPDDKDQSRNLKLTVVGVAKSVPPSNPPAEMVMSTAALPPYLLQVPDFYLARLAPGASPAAVASELNDGPLRNIFSATTIADQVQAEPRSLASLNLVPLGQLEAIGAGLIAAIGVAVLGAFIVVERRREFAILQTLGADSAQVRTGPALEGVITVLGSIVIGLPLGLGLGLVSVRILGLFFKLPPPVLTVPVGTLTAFVSLMVVFAAAAIGATLMAVNRVAAAVTLREPR
jgi:putative ABC transport system permease protein